MRPGGENYNATLDSPNIEHRASRCQHSRASRSARKALTMESRPAPTPPLRSLLTEAAEHRRLGDLAAANVLETDALRAIRASVATARAEVSA